MLCENCTDGTCAEPNICRCLDGFRMSEENLCEKMCLPDCIFGECVKGACICEEGYRLFNQSTHNCQPTVDNSCIYGTCGDNDTPVWEGTDETTAEFECSPPCRNGECKGNTSCELVCGTNEEDCANGTCISSGECKCFDGFELHPSSPFVCVLENMTSIESAPVKAIITNHISLILALLIVGVTLITLIFLLNRRNHKVDYNVDKKGKNSGKLVELIIKEN